VFEIRDGKTACVDRNLGTDPAGGARQRAPRFGESRGRPSGRGHLYRREADVPDAIAIRQSVPQEVTLQARLRNSLH
jgi:hypothetical protein